LNNFFCCFSKSNCIFLFTVGNGVNWRCPLNNEKILANQRFRFSPKTRCDRVTHLSIRNFIPNSKKYTSRCLKINWKLLRGQTRQFLKIKKKKCILIINLLMNWKKKPFWKTSSKPSETKKKIQGHVFIVCNYFFPCFSFFFLYKTNLLGFNLQITTRG
jgi:hypothetical protein